MLIGFVRAVVSLVVGFLCYDEAGVAMLYVAVEESPRLRVLPRLWMHIVELRHATVALAAEAVALAMCRRPWSAHHRACDRRPPPAAPPRVAVAAPNARPAKP